MGRPLKIGFYSPFFGSTIGGGEKYLGVAAEALHQAFPQHEVEIVSPAPADRDLYQRKLALNLDGIALASGFRKAGGWRSLLNSVKALRLYRDLLLGLQTQRLSSRYDLFLSMVYVIPAVSRARRSVMLCQFPYERRLRGRQGRIVGPLFQAYALPYRVLRRLLLGEGVATFDPIICQSQFVRLWVRQYWARDALVVNPPIDVPEAEPDWSGKRNLILSVGRFFAGGHTKRHDLMVECFRNLCDGGLQGWELHLAGSVHQMAADQAYYAALEQRAAGYPIHLHPNADYAEVDQLYSKAAIYWHAAGYGVDAERRPIDLEHFGMTTAEAMAHGAVPVVIARGGQPEVVEDGIDGLLWLEPRELEQKTLELVGDPRSRLEMGGRARQNSRRFSRDEFKRRFVDAVAPLVEQLQD